MKRLLSLLLAAVGLGCSPASRKPPAPAGERMDLEREFDQRVADFNRRTGAAQISVGELEEKLRRRETVVLLDVREPEEHAVSALPGACLLPPDRVSFEPLEIPPGATIVTYCTAGYRSGIAAKTLERRLGRAVLNLTGGIIEWFNQGGEVRGPEGLPADSIHPYGEEWAKYVHPRPGAEGSGREP